MRARETHAGWIFLVGCLMFGWVMGGGLEGDRDSDAVIEQRLLAISDVAKEVIDDSINHSDVLRDISELRREVDQLRSEVRQKNENQAHDNTEVIVDWLKESVGDLREEVRNLEIREAEHVVGVKEEEIERVKREVSDVKKDLLKLRVDEERSFSRMDEIGQRLEHVRKGEEMALNTIIQMKADVREDIFINN